MGPLLKRTGEVVSYVATGTVFVAWRQVPRRKMKRRKGREYRAGLAGDSGSVLSKGTGPPPTPRPREDKGLEVRKRAMHG